MVCSFSSASRTVSDSVSLATSVVIMAPAVPSGYERRCRMSRRSSLGRSGNSSLDHGRADVVQQVHAVIGRQLRDQFRHGLAVLLLDDLGLLAQFEITEDLHPVLPVKRVARLARPRTARAPP